MNDDFDDAMLEKELRAQRPVAASETLENRIAGLLAGNGTAPLRIPWWQRLGFARPAAAMVWGLASPAAAVAVTLIIVRADTWRSLPSPPVVRSNSVGKPASSAEYIPPVREPSGARAANVVYAAVDEGVVPDGDQGPMRRVRYRSTDHVQWRNPRTGAEWEVSYPREDVLLVPINAE